jgi:hydroxymethylglutaryl-CoA synthase
VDQMVQIRLADSKARVATYTVDHLAFSPSPPFMAAVLDFEQGGRYPCELTDVTADDLEMGMAFELTFRCFYTADGVRNYFWKARPAVPTDSEDVA